MSRFDMFLAFHTSADAKLFLVNSNLDEVLLLYSTCGSMVV